MRGCPVAESGWAGRNMLTSTLLGPMVPLLSLAAKTAAFLHQTTARNARHTSAIHQNQNANGNPDDQMDKVLMERRQVLLSDSSLLQQQHPQSTIAADNELRDNMNLSTEQMAHEALLSSRLPDLRFLNRSEVRSSEINGAGRGLFATENIPKGEIITCYPGDALLWKVTSSVEDSIVLWGAHVPKADVCEEDAVFGGTESAPPLTSYVVSVDDQYSVLGHPSLDDNPAYYGHYANDGAGLDELGLDIKEELGVEENIAAYVSKSVELANAMHKPFKGGAHMVTVATRDIEAGEEILVT
ncbi:hypothetical protein ACHAWF_017659 [Thalassiosira exigua]